MLKLPKHKALSFQHRHLDSLEQLEMSHGRGRFLASLKFAALGARATRFGARL
jgi:hypothetical protein